MPVPICKFSDHALIRLKERFDISPYLLSDLIDNKEKAFNLGFHSDNSLIRAIALPPGQQTHAIIVQDKVSGIVKTVWTTLIYEKVTGLKFRFPDSKNKKVGLVKRDRPLFKLNIDMKGVTQQINIGRCPTYILKEFNYDIEQLLPSELFEKWLSQCCSKNRILRSDIREIIVGHDS